MVNELSPAQLRRTCNPEALKCQSTEDLIPLQEIIGQKRAVRALKFGLSIKDKGFNIYVAGYPGTGRRTAVKDFLEELATKQPVPSDYCYVNNFKDEYTPKAIKLPPGKGKVFQKDMKNFVENAKRSLRNAFQSEDYAARRENTLKQVEAQRKQLVEQLNLQAQKEGFIIQSSPLGLLIIPVIKGKPIRDEELLAMAPEKRSKIQEKRAQLESELRTAMRQFMDTDRKAHEEIDKLNREIANYSIGSLVSELKEQYKGYSDVAEYLKDVQEDILNNVAQFIQGPEEKPQVPVQMALMAREVAFRKYEVNVIVDNSESKGAPVVIATNPTYHHLLGKIEREAQFGALITDFTMIRGGYLHRSNGGYLIILVEELLTSPFSYDALKRSLKNEQINIEELEERYGFAIAKSLKPEPISLKVKVVIIGDPAIYQQLYVLDKEFRELFKVKAEFDTNMERSEDCLAQYAAFVCTLCQKENLKPLDRTGLAKIIEYSSRLAEDQMKLSTRFAEVADIAREANFYAQQDDAKYITGDYIKKAIEEKVYRSKMVQEKLQEMINRDFILIDTEREQVGQVNGLSVASLGDFAFGMPSRVTVSVGLGREGVIDIEREAKMGGPIHTKGVLILSGYLNEKYAKDKPLTLSARVVFEQNYQGVEGDSASSTELYAILSNLSGLPINQSIAVTGSVNQKGEVQAIGGVNQKIEGFFEVCKVRGLSGKQGVMIPASNVQNLMLKEEIVDAVKEGNFHLYSVKNIDEGIEVLTGVKAGVRGGDGNFEAGTVNDLVDKQFQMMFQKYAEYATALLGEAKWKHEEES
ncbi:MAG: AAA family ATPase [Candidatus Bathyarchaeota archaeon]|nr:AAA family ATPase [Candidatus Bathyarchaeota archaeon]